jgi:hypothetical protein
VASREGTIKILIWKRRSNLPPGDSNNSERRGGSLQEFQENGKRGRRVYRHDCYKVKFNRLQKGDLGERGLNFAHRLLCGAQFEE